MNKTVPLYGFGSGGATLNFKVVPGLTQPGTAAENTIWVITEKIRSWYFSATQPEGLQELDVWFPTGTESGMEFNGLKKNGLQIYPLSAKQYISGACVDKTAKIYRGGEWVDLSRLPLEYQEVEYLQSSGTQYIDTGLDTDNGKTGIKIKFMPMTVYGYPYGSMRTSSPYPYFSTVLNSDYVRVEGANGATASTNIVPKTYTVYEVEHNYLGAKSYAWDKTTVLSNLADVPSSGLNIFLFGCNFNGGFNRASSIRLYACEITSVTDVVRNFVPCYRKSDSVAGLYDTINKKFYTNAGTGTFIVGGNS